MITNHRSTSPWALATLACAVLFLPAGADESRAPLPDPDGKPANMSKPVQVYILMGQSNMLGFGKINGANGSLTHAVKEKEKYPYLVDDDIVKVQVPDRSSANSLIDALRSRGVEIESVMPRRKTLESVFLERVT